jgi:hypothetical protein
MLQLELFQLGNQWSLYYNNKLKKRFSEDYKVIYGWNNSISGFLDANNNIYYIRDFLIEKLQSS